MGSARDEHLVRRAGDSARLLQPLGDCFAQMFVAGNIGIVEKLGTQALPIKAAPHEGKREAFEIRDARPEGKGVPRLCRERARIEEVDCRRRRGDIAISFRRSARTRDAMNRLGDKRTDAARSHQIPFGLQLAERIEDGVAREAEMHAQLTAREDTVSGLEAPP